MSAPDISAIIRSSIDANYRPGLGSILYAAFHESQIQGLKPYAWRRSITTDASIDYNELIPDGFTVIRKSSSRVNTVTLADSETATILIEHSHHIKVGIYVCATGDDEAKRLIDRLVEKVPESEKTSDESQVTLSTWHMNGQGPTRSLKSISAPAWSEIHQNYSKLTRDSLASLMGRKMTQTDGRIILLHGEPGTGKTTAIRSLIREWKGWCFPQYIADPELLFRGSSYLLEVIGTDSEVIKDNTWRLIIAEDSDEFLRVSARKEAGAALGRLLNLSDGILGQGSNTLILLTTNERLDKLHPALVRPGRCLAQIEFTKFSPTESANWLADGIAIPTEPKTLAELIELKNHGKRISNGFEPVNGIGTYL